jgi:hypothetical protein
MSTAGWRALIAVRVAASLVLASGFASLTCALLMGDIRIFTLAFFLVSMVAAVLGLPVYLAARAARKATARFAAISGFFVGSALPAVVIFILPGADSASVGGTATIVNGHYTVAGWVESFAVIGLFGLLGTGAALLFWLMVRNRVGTPVQDETRSPPRGRRMSTVLLSVAATIMVAAAFVIPWATTDRSCHNPLRSGQKSIAPVAAFDLRVGNDQWRDVEREVGAFGRAGAWSIFDDVRPDDSFKWLQISLCREPGTNIMVQGLGDSAEINFTVFQPQGGSSWRRDFRALYERLKAKWPANITFKDDQGRPTSVPEWATDKPIRSES